MSSELEAWGRVGDLLRRRLEVNPDPDLQARLKLYEGIPLREGEPDRSHPSFPSFAGGYQMQLDYVKQNPSKLNPEAGSPVRRSAGTAAWLNDVRLTVRGATSVSRGYFLRFPNPNAARIPNEAGDPDLLLSVQAMVEMHPTPPVMQILTGSRQPESFRVILDGPQQSFGREVKLWVQSAEAGESEEWPIRVPLHLPASWDLIDPASFPLAALPWQLSKLPPIRWNFSAIRADEESPWTAVVEVYPGLVWDSDFSLAIGSGSEERTLTQTSLFLTENLPEDPIQWSLSGKATCRMEGEEYDLTELTAAVLVDGLVLARMLEGLERWLKAVAAADRQRRLSACLGAVSCFFQGHLLEQNGNGLVGSDWRLRLKAEPLFQVAETFDFVPWFASTQKPSSAFLKEIIRMHDEHVLESRLGIQLQVRGQIGFDWRFRSARPGRSEAVGKAVGQVDLSLQGSSSHEFDTVVLYAGDADLAGDQPGICGGIDADSDIDDDGDFQPRVRGQYRWKGLALYGGYVSRAGARSGDSFWLDDATIPEEVLVISAPIAWPEDATKPASFFS